MAAFATSYIKTEAATVTRSADAASMTGTNFSSWYRPNEGVLYLETQRTGTPQTQDEGTGVELTSGQAQQNIIQPMYDNGSFNRAATRIFTASGLLQITGVNNGSPNFVAGELPRKFAVAYKSGDSCMANSGLVGSTNTSTFVPPLVNSLSIKTSSNGSQGSDFNGYVRKIAFYPARLTNAQLQALTTV